MSPTRSARPRSGAGSANTVARKTSPCRHCAASCAPARRYQRHYGATEALPVTTVSSDEIDPASVRGACVGRPVRELDVRTILITDTPITSLVEAQPRPSGTIGEIIVRGPVVTKTYDGLPPAT